MDELEQLIESQIKLLNLSKQPEGLYRPIEYVLSMGGKRLRPRLCLMACKLFGGDVQTAAPVAIGLEVFHNFTLLHDDIMDNAPVRRGKPTVHKVWNENVAILSGDAMLIEAYKLVARAPEKYLSEVLNVFSTTAVEVCEGQQYDMEFESRGDVSINDYINMIRLKTAVLLAGSLKIGAIIAGADSAQAEHLYNFGINLGLAFQLRDDYLDSFGDTAVFGKKIGGDILCGKKTFLLCKAFELADDAQKAELEFWLANKTAPDDEKIAGVLNIFRKLGVDAQCDAAVGSYCKAAADELALINGDANCLNDLMKLVGKLQNRLV